MELKNSDDEFKIIFENKDVGFKNSTRALNIKNDKRFGHIILKVGNEKKEILANPLILSLTSSFFDALFTLDNQNDAIDLFDMDPLSVDLLVRYLYTGILEISGTTVQNLLLSARRFQLTEVEEKCLEVLAQKLLPVNCLKTRDFASLHGFVSLREESDIYLNNNFTAMAQCPDFLNLSPSDLLKSVSNCSRKVTTNATILLAITRWVEHDEPTRHSHLPQLVRKIDLGELFDNAPELLQKAFNEGTILERSNDCSKMYYKMCETKAFERILLRKRCSDESVIKSIGQNNKSSTNESQINVKKIENASDEILMIDEDEVFEVNSTESDKIIDQKCSTHERVNCKGIDTGKNREIEPKACSSTPLVRTPSKRHININSISNDIIQNNKKRLRVVQSSEREVQILPNYSITNKMLVFPRFINKKKFLDGYNFQLKSTRTLHEVKPARRLSSLIFYDDKLYDLGGSPDLYCRSEDDDSSTSTAVVDIFNMRHTFVMEKLSLIESRKEFAACICQDYLYAIGGCQGIEAINCVERFPLNKKAKNKWQPVEYMEFARGAHDVTVLENKIYAIGGIGQIERRGGAVDLSSVVRYDPKRNHWESMPEMNEARGFVRSAAINNKIYAVGGNVLEPGFTNRRSLNSCEVYDPILSTWTLCSPMNHCRSRGTLITQNNLLYAIGGNSKLSPSMEVYDPRLEKWILLDWPVGLNKDADFISAIAIDA